MSVPDPTRLRGCAKGQVTRARQGLEGMLKLQPEDLDPTLIHKQLEIANRADASFEKHNQELQDQAAAGQDGEESAAYIQCEEELVLHEKAMQHVVNLTKTLTACEQASVLGKELILQLEDLTNLAETAYAPSMADQYASINADFKAFRNTLAVRGVLDCPPLARMRQQASNLWIRAGRARAVAEERARERSTPLEHASASGGSEVRVIRSSGSLKVPTPTFSGNPEDYQEFKEFFLAVLKQQTHLADTEKSAVLLGALKLEDDRVHARTAIAHTSSFKDALEEFGRRYEDPRDLMARYLNKLLQGAPITLNKPDLERMKLLVHDTMSGLTRIKSCTMEQFVPAYLESKFSREIYQEWRKATSSSKTAPDTKQLVDFLDEQIRRVGAVPVTAVAPSETPKRVKTETHSQSRQRNPHSQRSHSPPRRVLRVTEDRACAYCHNPHSIYGCTEFKNKTAAERGDWVRSKGLCFNCLGAKHRVDMCRSSGRCRECNRRHHTLLHNPRESRTSETTEERPRQVNQIVSTSSQRTTPATAVAMVSAGSSPHPGRIFCDTGAEVTLVSIAFCKTLQARQLNLPAESIGGVGLTHSPFAVSLTLYGDDQTEHRGNGFTTVARAVETLPQPSTAQSLVQARKKPFLKGKTLADPHYRPGDLVDIILDGGTWAACRSGEAVKDETGYLIAEDSLFGWVIGGSQPYKHSSPRPEEQVCKITKLPDPPKQPELLDDLLVRQWLTKEWPEEERPLSVEEAYAEDHFCRTSRILPDGRREVAMPILENAPELGESRNQAAHRFRSVQKAMQKKNTWGEYRKCVQDFVDQGHAEKVPEKELSLPPSLCYYLPMHGVTKTTSTSTRVRPVCDASARTTTGVAYNDTMATGPSLYHPLPSILLKFRDAAVALTADVSKMYRQISLASQDRNYHRFLLDGNGGDLNEFRMTRVTFGIKAAPFVAARTLRQIARDEQHRYPLAARIIEQSFYMDDVLTGADTLAQAGQIREQLNEALGSALMPLCKWRSNSAALLESIPSELQEHSDLTIGADPSEHNKTLGIHWATPTDELFVATPSPDPSQTLTKRRLISVMARVFDPMGWYSPALMTPRILAQEAWKAKTEWDEQLPESITETWTKWLQTLPEITKHPIARAIKRPNVISTRREVHGFSDASERGFGGVVYLRTSYVHQPPTVAMLLAKGRVAPIKALTVPRLELGGALVTAQLLAEVVRDLRLTNDKVTVWTDSTIVLGWLKQSPSKLNVYVGNRISKIHALLPEARWRHVRGPDNPADCLSRGMDPRELCQFDLWWNGPSWLQKQPEHWPRTPADPPDVLPELRRTVLIAQEPNEEFGQDLDTFPELLNAMMKQNRLQEGDTSQDVATSQEQERARRDVFRESQRVTYADEITLLKQGKTLPKNHALASATPFLDRYHLLRKGGRLAHADLPYTTRHPLILSHKSRIVQLFVKHRHIKMLHASCSAIMADVAYTYHVPRLKPMLKAISQNCQHCQELFARPVRQQMGNLPNVRSTPKDTFSSTGIDYAGPVYVKRGRGRNFVRQKTYLAIFVCMASRAVHIEVASDASTQSFLAALDRFAGRRGYPHNVYSDNGGNFVGAAAELHTLTAELRTDSAKQAISEWTADRDITWHFSPARAPNFGGLWEAGVKQMKRLLHTTLKDVNLSFEELNTVSIAAEAVLNSRPYIPLSSTSEDAVCPLTPGHFLIGRPLTAIPQKVDLSSKIQNVRRWGLVKRLQHQMWTRWRKTYLPTLLNRAKQLSPQTNLAVGDLVMVSDVDTPRGKWPIGKVKSVCTGPDSLVRVVEVQIGNTTLKRSVRHLVKLPQEHTSATTMPCGGVCVDFHPSLGEVAETSP